MNSLERRIKEKYPNENIEVVSFTIMKEPATVKCLKCNNIYSLRAGENFVAKNKKCICKKCVNSSSGGRSTLEQFQVKINEKYPQEQLKSFKEWIKIQNIYNFFPLPEDIHSHTLILASCKKCGKISKKTIYDYLKGCNCVYCVKNVLKTKEQFQKEVGEEYKILQYKGMDHSALIRHELCGFIFKRNPRAVSCPRCNKRKKNILNNSL